MSKILIVDDDREIASLIGDSLYDEGYEIKGHILSYYLR